jgi:PAS domain S-box-containing protein
MAREEEPRDAGVNRPRVLLADDHPEICESLTRLLGDLYDIRSASDAATASVWVRDWYPDVVVADVALRDGPDGAGDRRAHAARWGNIPTIWYSTTAINDAAVDSMGAGDTDVVVPFSEQQLLALVRAETQLIRMRDDAHKALRQSEDRFRTLKTSMIPGVWIANANGGMVGDLAWWWEQRTGQTPDMSSGLGWMDVVHPDDRSRVREVLEGAMAQKTAYQMEFRVRDRHGAYRYVRTQGAPIRDGSGVVREWIGTLFDIDDQRQTEEALRLSETRHRTFVSMTTAAVWTMTPETHVVTALSGWEELTGQTPGEVQNFGWVNALHPDDRTRMLEEWRSALRTGNLIDSEFRVRRKDGRYTHVRDYGIPVRGPDGVIVEWIGALIDIDRQKAAEVALRTSESELRANFELAGIGQVQTDPQTRRYVRVNDRFCEMVGYSRDELLTMTYLDITHPDDRSDARGLLDDLKEDTDGKPRVDQRDKRYVRKDGSALWALVTSTLIRDSDGRPLRTVTMVEDVTERRHAEALALCQQQALEMVAQGASLDDVFDFVILAIEKQATVEQRGSIHVLDGHGKPRQIRAPSLSEGCRQALAACLANSPRTRRAMAASKRPIVVEDVADAPEWADLAEVLRPCGTRAIWATPILSSGRRLRGNFCLYASAPRRPSATELQLLENVAHTIALTVERREAEAEREEILMREQTAREVAEEANRLKDEFMAGVSHELRTPLNAINGWAQILLRGAQDGATQVHALQSIQRHVRSQAALINDLLDVARIAAGKIRLDLRAVNPASVIHASLDVVRPTADAKRIDLRVELDATVTTVLADAERLQQVLVNLLSNAIKFTPEGGRITVGVRPGDDGIEIGVADTGHGISPDFLPYVFDRFRQAETMTTRKHEGLGLGLAIVRQLVELHGGTVWAESAGEGQGATFTMRLPRPAAAVRPLDCRAVEGATPPASRPVDGRRDTDNDNLDGLRVLVVEDSREDREILTAELAHHGAQVSAAESAAEGLVELHEFRPDVLVADIGMAGEDGYRLIRRVRTSPLAHERHTPAIALTAYAGDTHRKRALEAGYQEHMTKPADPDELVRTIVRLAQRDAA